MPIVFQENINKNHKSEISKSTTEWKIDQEIKKELEDSATQNIEEFQTQDIDFPEDFTNEPLPDVTAEGVKTEEISSSSATITDVAEEYLNESFEIFPKAKEPSQKNSKEI